MPDVVAELVRRTNRLEQQVEELRARERFIAFDYDYLRGWKDDFFGDALHEQYAIETVGGSVALLNNFHGGCVRLTAGPVLGNYARLWLGDAAGGHDTLDADKGWVQIARLSSSVGLVASLFGATDQNINTDVIRAGYDSASSANWCIFTRSGGGAWNVVDSGVAPDTAWHWHVLDVYPTDAGRQVDYYLDGDQIATTTIEVPTAVITPIVYCLARVAAATKRLTMDYWAVIPRDL